LKFKGENRTRGGRPEEFFFVLQKPLSSSTSLFENNHDGLVKSPSAALRGNFAPLDKKPHSWEAGMKLLIFEGKNHFEKYLTG
jgi:hypothetical protein